MTDRLIRISSVRLTAEGVSCFKDVSSMFAFVAQPPWVCGVGEGGMPEGSSNNGTVEAVVEVPRGGRNKYEYDDKRGVIRLDRVLYSSVHYPTDYGFIPETLAEDGDHLDILIVVEEPTFPGCRVPARPIAVLNMVEVNGEDQKILAVPVGDPRFETVDDVGDISPHWLREIENFFDTYKALEDVQTCVRGWEGADQARAVIVECAERYRTSSGR